MRNGRFSVLLIIILLLTLVVLARLMELQIFRHKGFKERAQAQHTRVIRLAPDRGDIFDRNGRLLATSIDSYSIYVNPRVFKDHEKLSRLLGEKVPVFSKDRYFVWVKRKIDREIMEKIKQADLPGLDFLIEKKRIYPKRHLLSQVLGFVGIDNEGLSGLELSYDEYLKAKEGKVITESDPRGYELLSGSEKELSKASSGMNLTLTIDESIQYLAEKELEQAVKKHRARKGLMIVLDLESGEILALAGKPDFDPNHYSDFSRLNWKSPAVDVYEPGSTFKTMTVLAALNEGEVDKDTRLKALDTIRVADRVISNSHDEKWTGSTVSLSKMLQRSINTAVAQISLKLGRERFYRQIKRLGFGEETGSGLPSESRGIVREPRTWSEPALATIAFGQGIAVTPLQMVCAYAAIGNQGEKARPYLVKKIESVDGKFLKTFNGRSGERVASKKNAEIVKEMLCEVVDLGTGKPAHIKYYSAAGKTGTSQKPGPFGGYLKDQYIASFAGFAPAGSPRLAAIVIIDDPKDKIWGEAVAAPVFSRVLGPALRYLNVPADML